MNKRNKIILIAILIISSFSVIPVKAENSSASKKYEKLEESLISEFGIDYEVYLKNNQYQLDVAQKIDKIFKNNYKDSYPLYYGGMYISDDSKNLILQIVEKYIPNNNTNEYKIYKDIISVDDSIIIKFVENSFEQLKNTQEIISNNGVNNVINYNSSYIDVINNDIVVELTDNSSVKQVEFENKILNKNTKKTNVSSVVEKKLITYKKGEKNETKAINELKAGSRVDGEITSCSMAFRTKLNGKKGYVTAGHCFLFDGLNAVIKTGTVKKLQYKNNEKYDYAFVQTNSLYTLSNYISYAPNSQMHLLVTNTCPLLVVGTAIAKSGQTTKYTTGKITALNQTVYYENNGRTIKGLIKTNLISQPGDSGGAIFIPKTSSTAIPIGVLSGGNDSNTYFTSIESLPSALQTGRY